MSLTLNARLLCGVAVVALSSAGAAWAEDTSFSIQPQALTTALNAFSEQSQHPVLFKSEMAAEKVSPGVSGVMDPEQALAQMLTGADLSFRRAGDTFVIVQGGSADPQSASAGGDVDALIVTAQKREENIQDVPIAISAFSQEDLTTRQVAGGPDLMTQVPNMTFTKTNFSSYSIQIRGIGTQAISATVDPAVAVAFNNTPFVRNRFFEQEFYDLQRVEVLRGPQGTLYGRNATAGVVNIISAKPKFSFEVKASADVANYKSSRLEGMINIPLVEDKVALRIAGAWTKREGFVTNTLTGEQTDGRNLWSGRLSLAIEPTDWFRADLIYEHFEEDDDRLRSGKQLCMKDPAPETIGGVPVRRDAGDAFSVGDNYFSQGCKPASMYSPDAFHTPNGHSLRYYNPIAQLGVPVDQDKDPYLNATQSRDLREIETHIVPEYEASAELVELQLQIDLPSNLTLVSETGFNIDSIFSFEDYNRFNTTPGVFGPSEDHGVDENGVFCDPQLGCTDRLAAGDLAAAESQQFSQEFRLASNYEGRFNYSLGANFLRYDTEDKYYVFVNSLALFAAGWAANDPVYGRWIPGVSENEFCITHELSDPNRIYGVQGCKYIDPNDIHNLNDQGRQYFVSRNPYHLISYSAFGEAYFEPTPDLKITGGLRWTVDRKTAPVIPGWLLASSTWGTPTRKVVEQEWGEPTGRLTIDWKPDLPFTDETMVYGSYARGYKAGGANPPNSVIVLIAGGTRSGADEAVINDSLTHPATFEPEFVNAFEIGAKNTFADGAVTANLNAFYYDYKAYQISQIVDRAAVNLNFDAEVWGSELEIDWRAAENLRIGFKGGYEQTRMADGSQAIDLMDRTAGDPGWVVMMPAPPSPNNCIVPVYVAATALSYSFSEVCTSYITHEDPFTYLPYVPNPTVMFDGFQLQPLNMPGYPGFDPDAAPNHGEGIAKDLSGNELPNAPNFTATVTLDYTLPLPREWLMTLHTDLYYQSEAWTRVFNMDGYDKLKAYSNVNFAAIFTNEDAGWNVMAYVKNVLNRDSITGAFLNSDDTGLTTNVFLTEPRLYGLRVTKSWTGGAWWTPPPHTPGEPYPLTVELGGMYGPLDAGREFLAPPLTSEFGPGLPYPLSLQEDLDWSVTGEAKLTYAPRSSPWSFSASARYGRANGEGNAHARESVTGGYIFAAGDPEKYLNPSEYNQFNYAETSTENLESHTIVDFMVGKDIGIGDQSSRLSTKVSAGLRYAHLGSSSWVDLHGRTDLTFPPEWIARYGIDWNQVDGELRSDRDFAGAGPVAAWESAVVLAGDATASGRMDLEFGLEGSLLFGRQQSQGEGEYHQAHHADEILSDFITHPIAFKRSESVAVPTAQINVGLSYTLGGVKVRGGYRAERFFDVIEGGIEEREKFDRSLHGPYFKISVGFGG